MQAAGSLTQSGSPIVEALNVAGRRNPAATALVWRQSAWTYLQLLDAIKAVTDRLASLDSGSRVAILLRNSPQYVALYYGILAAGCVAVPLNAQERAGVLAHQVDHSGAEALIGDATQKEWSALCSAVPSNVETISFTPDSSPDSADRFIQELNSLCGSAHRARSHGAKEHPITTASPSSPDHLAVILYTSGTTGRPKGVMLSHGNLLSNAQAIITYLGLTASERGLCVLPFHFSYGNSVLNSHLLCGATLLLEDNLAFPHVTLERIQNDAITGFAGVPATFALLLGRCRLEDYNLRTLRYITQAGGAMPRATIERLRAATPGIEIFIMYGQTEATARLTYLSPEKLDDKLGSVGLPIDGVEIKVRDDQGRAVPSGTIGEIYARGPNVMLGYWHDPEATRNVLRDGWLRTGDLGHCDSDGYLYIDGRAVEMIKTGAFRVSPQEVEEAISGLEGVQEVAVTGVPDDMLGQAIMAVVIPKPGSDLDARAVKAHCHQRLAAYKVPKQVDFVTEFPRTASGKVQRLELARRVNHG